MMAYNSSSSGVRVKVKLRSGNRCRCTTQPIQTHSDDSVRLSAMAKIAFVGEPQSASTGQSQPNNDRKIDRRRYHHHHRHVRLTNRHLCK